MGTGLDCECKIKAPPFYSNCQAEGQLQTITASRLEAIYKMILLRPCLFISFGLGSGHELRFFYPMGNPLSLAFRIPATFLYSFPHHLAIYIFFVRCVWS